MATKTDVPLDRSFRDVLHTIMWKQNKGESHYKEDDWASLAFGLYKKKKHEMLTPAALCSEFNYVRYKLMELAARCKYSSVW